jgi:hypothetical protein
VIVNTAHRGPCRQHRLWTESEHDTPPTSIGPSCPCEQDTSIGRVVLLVAGRSPRDPLPGLSPDRIVPGGRRDELASQPFQAHNGRVRLMIRTGLDWYQKHSFIGTVGIRPFNESGSVWNYPTVGPQSGTGMARTVRLLPTVPVPVRTNKRTHPI